MNSGIGPKSSIYNTNCQPVYKSSMGLQIWTNNAMHPNINYQIGQNQQIPHQIPFYFRIPPNSFTLNEPRLVFASQFNPNYGFYHFVSNVFNYPSYLQPSNLSTWTYALPNNQPHIIQARTHFDDLTDASPATTIPLKPIQLLVKNNTLCYFPISRPNPDRPLSKLQEDKKITKDVLRHFEKITNTFVKIFRNPTELSPTDFDLTPAERILLFEIMTRKFRASEIECKEFRNSSSEVLLAWVVRRCVFKSKKRIEERKKFVYKHTLKHMKEQFFKKVSGLENYTNKKIEQVFYNHYFQNSELELQPANDWLDPFNSKDALRKHKTLSRAYLSTVFECDLFRDDFMLYFEGPEFIKDYQSSIRQKILILMKRSELLFEHSSSLEHFAKTSSDYFQKNNQCKFPWCTSEINHSIGSFKDFLKRVTKK